MSLRTALVRYGIMVVAAAGMGACTHNKNEVKEIDTTIDAKGSVDGGTVGIDKKGEAIIQNEASAQDELRRQQWANSQLEADLGNQHFELRRCRRDLADPRLGGSGEPTSIPDVDNMKDTTATREEFGLDAGGALKVVKREYFLERLEKERKYETTLRSMAKLVKDHLEKCQTHMAVARRQTGLPSERYRSEGYFTNNGTWVETKKAEQSLDDAFERAAGAAREAKR